jgi:hypothetical protein
MPLRFEVRRGVSEVVSSMAVLIITIALLGGISAVALGSIRSSSNLLSSSSQNAAKGYALLLAVVSVQTNSTGSYAWVYNYGWVQGTLAATYVDGSLTQSSTNCSGVVQPQNMCSVRIPPSAHGVVSLVFGTKSLGFSV